MAKTRAEVLAALRALGLTNDEANEELRSREAEAQKLVAAASPDARANVLVMARVLLRLERPLYITKNLDTPPDPGFVEVDAPPPAVGPSLPGAGRGATQWLGVARSRCRALAEGPKWRLAVALVVPVLVLSIAGIAIAGGIDDLGRPFGASRKDETLAARDTLVATPVPDTPVPEPHIAVEPAYEVVYTLTKKRLDGGKTLYVLIDPVDISNANFEDDLKLLVKGLVGQYGPSISIEIHDDPNSLRASYARFGDKSARLPLTAEEGTNEALHFVAAFNGNLNTGMYLNTLQFYSAATPDTPLVGQYTEDIEFNPAQ